MLLRTFHSFLAALPRPLFSRKSHLSSSGGVINSLPVSASRIRTRTRWLCIETYCRNRRLTWSSRLIWAQIKLRASKTAWDFRNECPRDPVWWRLVKSIASGLSLWKYMMNPQSSRISTTAPFKLAYAIFRSKNLRKKAVVLCNDSQPNLPRLPQGSRTK